MKIPFNVKFRPQIESGEYKVVTGDDRPVRIISWDKRVFGGRYEIVALVPTAQGDTETVQLYCPDGTLIASNWNEKYRLFLITPEEELTEWQRFISACLQKHGLLDCGTADRIAKESATELLNLAREQFIKDGYVIEKKAFHDVVEKIDDKHEAKMSIEYSLHCKVENGTRHAVMSWEEFKKLAQMFIDLGKAEALKDLPRWRIAMSKRAEEAWKNYLDGPAPMGIGEHFHFLLGYEQAEKDLALTKDDVWTIYNLVRELQVKYSATEGCLQEVADIFNKQRTQ